MQYNEIIAVLNTIRQRTIDRHEQEGLDEAMSVISLYAELHFQGLQEGISRILERDTLPGLDDGLLP